MREESKALRQVTRAVWLILAVLALLGSEAVRAEEGGPPATVPEEPFGIALEGFPYPYPVHMFPIVHEGETLRMAYLDVAPKGEPNGRTILLLHGRNFPSRYWQSLIETLAQAPECFNDVVLRFLNEAE